MEVNYFKTQEELRDEQRRRKLSQEISTKIRTSFIYALAQFEENFEFLWTNQDKLTEAQQRFLEKWQECRKNILDNGNRQIRTMERSIKKYRIEENGKSQSN